LPESLLQSTSIYLLFILDFVFWPSTELAWYEAMMAEEDEVETRVNLARKHGIWTGVLIGVIMGLAVAAYLYISNREKEAGEKKKANEAISGEEFRGGKIEASDVVQVPGSNGLLIVDDGSPNAVLWMGIDQSGRQVGDIVPIPLGVEVQDPEAITFDGTYFYVAGSQSDPGAKKSNAIVRFRFDSSTRRILEPEAVENFRDLLINRSPMLKGEGEKNGRQGGLNIEGMVWDPNSKNKRLLLGLRNPLIEGQALIIPISLRNPGGPFSEENLQVEAAQAIRISLEGSGIRSLSYDEMSKSFLILSGAPEPQKKTDFKLWDWKGDGSQPTAREVLFDKEAKPEGVTRVSLGSDSFVFVVFDTGRYARLP
jgi:hypothetical protein